MNLIKGDENSISRRLARNLFPVTLGIGLLISVGFPALYALLESRSLKETSVIYAQELADDLQHLILEDAVLWKYQAHRYNALLDSFIPHKNILSVRVADKSGQLLPQFDYRAREKTEFLDYFTVTGTTPIMFNNELVGMVRLEISADKQIKFTLFFFIISSLIGAGLSLVAYYSPVTIVTLLEGELQKLNEELEERVEERTAQLNDTIRELETFSYSVSHDLRAPLRHIGGFSRALMEDYGETLERGAKDYLNRICIAEARMSGQLDGLLDLSRINRFELVRQEVDLSSMACSVAEELRLSDPERTANFIVGEGIVVNSDPRLLRNVLENLLGNAWKFTSRIEAAVIEVGSDEQDGKTVLYVRDNGDGFDMTYAERLFSPFQRLHRSEDFEGTGIGLATVQRIIHRHGGRIWAESSPGAGATFFFTLQSAA